MRYGLSEYEVERIIKEQLEKNADLKYYIDNDYINELVELLVKGISKVIEENNKKIISDITSAFRRGIR
jgi:hypothetical protein